MNALQELNLGNYSSQPMEAALAYNAAAALGSATEVRRTIERSSITVALVVELSLPPTNPRSLITYASAGVLNVSKS